MNTPTLPPDAQAAADILARLAAVIESRKPAHGGDPEKSYVARLLHKGPDAFLKKSAKRLPKWSWLRKTYSTVPSGAKSSMKWPIYGSTA